MKILVCCGSGLGSSFMMEMNIKKLLKELDLEGIEVSHTDLSSAAGYKADLYVATRDIADQLTSLGEVLTLNSMIDKKELKEKLTKVFKEKNLL
ncbi:PTS sugar transporter subunit IIB [Clostridium sediminicola]|uniref:PTS sugar transporter subunit IIB n=1 Tax=Clostridium sediminicola TaxID=3114879 RepID=UPI0031F216C5